MSNKFLTDASLHLDGAIVDLVKYIEFFDDADIKEMVLKLYDFKDMIDYLNKGVKIKTGEFIINK